MLTSTKKILKKIFFLQHGNDLTPWNLENQLEHLVKQGVKGYNSYTGLLDISRAEVTDPALQCYS